MVDSLKVYDILKEAQIPEQQARAITQAIRESDTVVALDVRSVLEEKLAHLATKGDLAELRAAAKADLIEWKAEFKGDMLHLKAELKGDMANLKAELTRWMFLFWVGQMAATAGIIFAAFRLWR